MICCFSGSMPIPVSETDSASTPRARRKEACSGLHPACASRARTSTRPCSVNLKAFESRFFRTCWSRLPSVLNAAGQPAVDLDAEREPLGLGDVPERALERVGEVREGQLARLHGHRARLDLGEVEDVVDQREQVPARGQDRLRELHLAIGQVALGVLGQPVGEDQQAVERRAQLVGHVGQELGLVLRGERELRRLLLERLARLLDLLVLPLDLDVLDHELARLLLELLVRLLELLLLALELSRERLRLAQQLLRAGVGLDRVEDDPDALRELLEEGQVRVAEPLEGGELDDGLHLPLEEHGQHHDVERGGLPEARGDAHVVRRHVGEEDALLLEGRLAHEPLPEAEVVRDALANLEGVAREEHAGAGPRRPPPS